MAIAWNLGGTAEVKFSSFVPDRDEGFLFGKILKDLYDGEMNGI